MKIYKINFQDNYGDYTGSLCQVYSNRAAAEKAKAWHSSHPDPCEPSLTYFIEEIDVDNAVDEFVPPMSEDDYKHMFADYYGDCDDEEYPEDYYDEYPEPTEEELEDNAEQPKDYSHLLRNIFWIVVGLGCLIYGSNLFVDAATYVAHRFGVRQSVIGLTIVAGGTSLPELATSVVAAYKGRSAIAIGNVIGSNVFNILLILGSTAVISPLRIMGITIVDLMVLLVTIGFMWLFAFTKFYVSRREGAVLVGCFVLYMGWLFYLI
jgi:Ca2+/Na+ antiporter